MKPPRQGQAPQARAERGVEMTPFIDAGDLKFVWARNDLGRHKLLVQVKTTVPPKETGLPPMIINSGIWVSHESAIALRDALLEQYPLDKA